MYPKDCDLAKKMFPQKIHYEKNLIAIKQSKLVLMFLKKKMKK